MKKRLMVVDDSRVEEMQICNLLENTEFEVDACCENGEEAIARYEELRPDVVTMDLIMPGIDGLETAQIILEKHPEANIVMVSALGYGDSIHEAEAIGIRTFVKKPVNRENLIRALEQALA